MFKWLRILGGTLRSVVKCRRDPALENPALRQRLAVLKHAHPGVRSPRCSDTDRIFWIFLSKIWRSWNAALRVAQPETVGRWHCQGSRYYWRWKSRGRGRPKLDPGIRALIRRMCRANPLWGAPRIHGEWLELGTEISETTVAKYVIRCHGPRSQAWRHFLLNHAKDTIALDFFAVPTATFKVLFILIILSHDRRRILHFNAAKHPTATWTARQLVQACRSDEAPRYLIRDRDGIYGEGFHGQARALEIEEVPTAPQSPWHNSYAERLIGSIRRECLNHVVVLGARHLHRILSSYAVYYNQARTHLSLSKDAPAVRLIQPPDRGVVRELAHVGGLHHEYVRMAA
jgi:putative transposase